MSGRTGGATPDRLDKAVARLFGVSRGRALEWIADGRVRVDGRRAPKGAPAPPGCTILVERPPPDQPAPEPDLPIRIVHADAHLVVAEQARRNAVASVEARRDGHRGQRAGGTVP